MPRGGAAAAGAAAVEFCFRWVLFVLRVGLGALFFLPLLVYALHGAGGGVYTCQSSSRRGRGMHELDVDEDRQPKPTKTVTRTIPEDGGPIPLHRDTTKRGVRRQV